METGIRTTNFCKSSQNTSLVLSLHRPFRGLDREKWNCCDSEPKDPQRSWHVAKQFYATEMLQLSAHLT